VPAARTSGAAPEALVFAREGTATADRIYTEPNRFHPSIHATLAAAELADGDTEAARDAWLRARELLGLLTEPPPSVAGRIEQAGLSYAT